MIFFVCYGKKKKSGANSAFHEAVGDTIVYAAMSPQHRLRLGLDSQYQSGQSIVFIVFKLCAKLQELIVLVTVADVRHLLRVALSKIPLLPFSLVVDKWRWSVFSGVVKPTEYNKRWWQLVASYQGFFFLPIKMDPK